METAVSRAKRLLLVVGLTLPLWACATYQTPVPIDRLGFRDRTKVTENERLRVSVAVLDARESREAFGVDLAAKKIQPVWLEVANKTAQNYFFFPAGTDPEYYSPFEVAYECRVSFAGDANRRMAAHFEESQMPIKVAPQAVASGFVFTRLDEGLKYVQVELLGDQGIESFAFLPDVPGRTFDWQTVDFQAMYPGDEIESLDRDALREAISRLPCCTADKTGAKSGDPLNLVIVGEIEEVLRAMVHRGWDPTHMLNFKIAAKTAGAFLFGSSYRYSPVSPLHVYGRSQDLALQKVRRTIHQRNHLRLWLAPFRYGEKEVWIGQISRDVGIRFTLKAPFATTHKIDPDVDEARDYLLQDLLISQLVEAVGAASGVGEKTRQAPGRNLTGDPFFTDGLRVVLFLGQEPTPVDEVEFLRWEAPARFDLAPRDSSRPQEKLGARP